MPMSTSEQTYEQIYARMQAVVGRLESGELPLNEALALYEEGMALATICQRLLDEAELRVRELQSMGTGIHLSAEEGYDAI